MLREEANSGTDMTKRIAIFNFKDMIRDGRRLTEQPWSWEGFQAQVNDFIANHNVQLILPTQSGYGDYIIMIVYDEVQK